MYAGGVVLACHDGYVVQRAAAGYALRYADGAGTELPRDQWVPTRTDTIFDLASVSKLFTAIALVQQVYVEGIHVTSQGRTVFDDSRPWDADAVQPAGWSASAT